MHGKESPKQVITVGMEDHTVEYLKYLGDTGQRMTRRQRRALAKIKEKKND